MDCKNVLMSVIVPVYNTGLYLEKCLNSIVTAVEGIEQKVEVLLINDGSTDHSQTIIDEYCDRYSSFMKKFQKPNGGLSDVKNYGLQRANGKYVIFLDSDDFIEANMYRDMLECAEKNSADVVVCDIKLTYDDASKDQVHSCTVSERTDIFQQVIDMSMMPASWNKLVKKELYDGLEFPVGKNNEDVAVTPIILGRANRIMVIHEPYYNYYQRTGSIQNSEFNEKRFVVIDTAKLCMERINGLPAEKADKIKGSVYLHQVLAIAMYPIREERFQRRYNLLKKYIRKVNEEFPDLWEHSEIREFLTWEDRMTRLYRKISVYLLKHNLFLATSAFWSFCNWFQKMK